MYYRAVMRVLGANFERLQIVDGSSDWSVSGNVRNTSGIYMVEGGRLYFTVHPG